MSFEKVAEKCDEAFYYLSISARNREQICRGTYPPLGYVLPGQKILLAIKLNKAYFIK